MSHDWFRAGTLALLALTAAPVRAADPVAPVAQALARADAAVQRIVALPEAERDFDRTIGAIDDLIAQLEIDTNLIQFMAYVSIDAEERRAGQQAEEEITNWLIDLYKNEPLYRAVRSFADAGPALEGEQGQLLKHVLRDFRRAGMELSVADRSRLAEIEKEITALSIEFERNIRDDESRVPLLRDELRGLPEDYFGQFGPDRRHGDLLLVGLSYPEFLPIVTLCENETTRKRVWVAYKRRGGQKNVSVLERILKLRAQAAALLKYEHPADYEIEVRMAKDAATVMRFYEELRPLVRRKAERDLRQFTAAKQRHTGRSTAVLYPWDTAFYQNLIKKERFEVDSEAVREYFPLEAVLDGLFSITQSLYGLEYHDVTAAAPSRGRALWHEDVKLYEVRDRSSGRVLGEFSLDLHPRPNKYTHAAQWGLGQHKVWSDGRVSLPVAALVCNFTKPTAQKPSLMTHDEVETFFHEFGHCLHTILSEARYWTLAGTHVERDFVEAPSQMFENWVWDADVLSTFARHYKTNATFPPELLRGMIDARHLGSGLDAEHQFYYGLVDMAYHTVPDGVVDTTKVANDLFTQIEQFDSVPCVFFQASFGHLTGYQAGYYGYQWSLVYACDMFERFGAQGMLNPAAGMEYRQKILARGGTVDGQQLVREYLGREPDPSAYLRHLGLEDEE
jgi:thimet oligopeptidase